MLQSSVEKCTILCIGILMTENEGPHLIIWRVSQFSEVNSITLDLVRRSNAPRKRSDMQEVRALDSSIRIQPTRQGE